MSFFYVDLSVNQSKTWEKLFFDLKGTKRYNKYCQDADFYNVFKQIILSLLLGEEIVLLDADFSEDEIKRLTANSIYETDDILVNKQLESIESKEDLFQHLRQINKEWQITLYTSGTTGLPKRISHSFQSITRFVKKSENHSSNVWGFAYNPTHMAGIQVFFQALLNGNPIVRLFGLSKEQIFESISEFAVTNISATPTFYRLLLPKFNQYPTVKRLTSGGEKFDEKTTNALKQIFPNAKITNVYASTEAGTLLASSGNNFFIKPEFKGLIKVIENELVIHKSLMGNSDIFSDEWYHTGDIVEIISQNPLNFHFISRKNEMINVGGYKVNPHEVEEAIREIDGVSDVRVFAKSNSVLGNIICSEVVINNDSLNESLIRNQLQTKLQEFKIPRLIKLADKISTTRTGKIKRN
ncbi:MAG: fatty acid--CoA ligase family protein [Prolixibacteraceae bacterium]|nr:fatty acid--CoA ligase family protein [Prolixibacteraceae bacterium]